MAECTQCKKFMSDRETTSCKEVMIVIDGKEYKPDTSYFDKNERCHDCGIVNQEGNVHHLGCDMEKCPKCNGQLISCECSKE